MYTNGMFLTVEMCPIYRCVSSFQDVLIKVIVLHLQ